ncbi:MAG: NAD(P)-dependent alcohol dehydrogenase [Anaerolineales bacterium]
MKAIIWTKYGSPDGLQLREVTASLADTEFRNLKLPSLYVIPLRLYFGILKPLRVNILGTEFAGEVVATGKAVTRHQPGDQLYGYTGLRMGTYAEYLCLPEKSSTLGGVIAPKPVNMTYEEAATVPFGGLEALHGLRQANLQPGQRILIVGAGGSIGTYTVQLAKHYGAEVTGVDKPGKFEMLRSIGADHLVDYTKEDFTQNGQQYDVILDTIGKSPFASSLRSLKEHGAYVNANVGMFGKGKIEAEAKRSNKRIIPWSAGYSVENLLELKKLIEAGTLKAVIDHRYSLAQMAEAHRYVETGQKKGNVVVTVP